MPNKHTTDGNYRYAFQGQEKDAETGMEAFELRLWDGRLGRWLTVDPYHEFHSPYVGMGNNPINLIDPDGGATDPPKGAKAGATYNDPYNGKLTFNGTTWKRADGVDVLNEVVLIGKAKDHGSFIGGFIDKFMNHDPTRSVSQQGYSLDTFRTHSFEDYSTNVIQSIFGVDDYNTGDQDYDSGAKAYDNLVTLVSVAVPGYSTYRASKPLLKRGTTYVVRKIVQQQALRGVDDVIANPSLLEGKSISQVQNVLKNTSGWIEGTLTKGRSSGQGWTLRQLNSKGTDFTGLYIQYSPGSPRHFGGKPYWKVSSGNGGTQWFQAGQ